MTGRDETGVRETTDHGVIRALEEEQRRGLLVGPFPLAHSVGYDDPARMPLINVYTSSKPLSDDMARDLLKDLSASVATHLHKPERYVMAGLLPQTRMMFGGSETPCCYVEVKSMGTVASSAAKALCADVSARLSRALGIAADQIFIVFSEVPGHLWGHGSSTFG